ncbi:MAG: hypothetical protein AAGM38_09375 [Pseudomonadota bacterium]
MNDIVTELIKAVEKKARAYLGTIVEGMILEIETKSFSEVLDGMSMPAMIGIVEVEGVDRAAFVNLDMDLVFHVVDLRMGGSPSELPEFAARRPTGIDNAMCAPLVDMIAEGFSRGLNAAFGVDEEIPMRCTNFEHMPMSANIAPERSDVLSVKVSLDIGEAARSGDFEFVLPFSALDLMATRLKKSSSHTSNSRDAWAAHMLDVVLETPLDIQPVLHSAIYSVADVSDLEVGGMIILDEDAQHNVQVQVDLPDEPLLVLGSARLGSLKRNKALKMLSEPDPEFFEPLRSMVSAAER